MQFVKSIYWRVRSQALDTLKGPAALLARQFGYTLLTKRQTVAYLSESLVATHPESACLLPEVRNVADPAKVIFQENNVVAAPSYVWRYDSADKPSTLLRCGLLMVNNNLLNTDFWNNDALTDILKPTPRPQYQTRTLLAPIGHYFDGNKLVGYYDFMFLIAAKLCRIKEAVPDAVFRQAVVAYPLVHTSYEREFLTLLGFGADRVFDSRHTDVRGDICYLGNLDNWMHQNVADVLLLKKHLGALLHTPRTAHNRVYISRADRRRIRNEESLIELLLSYDFIIVDDKPRSLVEQYAIYHNASFILGPHGASFSNLLWCEPGTHVVEIFAARYAPPHFLYLAQVLDLRYSAYCQDTINGLDYGAIGADIEVSIPELMQCLDTIFSEE